jgi:hypothetical protein
MKEEKVFEKCRLSLRKHIQDNRSQVLADLNEIVKQSKENEMKTTVSVKDLGVDNLEIIIEKLKFKNLWELVIYPANNTVGVTLEHVTSEDGDSRIMFDLDKEDAIFLAKSIIASAELIED